MATKLKLELTKLELAKQMVLNEVELYVLQHGYMPTQVMVTDNVYAILRNENLAYKDNRIILVSCTRIVNEETSKQYHAIRRAY